jgi:MOSC domain-containing protein YiiM
MWQGTVTSIHIASMGSAPMVSVAEAHARAGKGLVGDRYFTGTGTWSHIAGLITQVTLAEIEAIEALARDNGINLDPGDARRNIVTRGVPLNHLVGQEFVVGDIVLRGIRLVEPCAHLAKLTEHKVLSGLVHRGGLRAEILTDGVVRVGDAVREHYPSRVVAQGER